MAVALLVCGVALLATHVEMVGATMYVPGIEKNKDPYWTLCLVEPYTGGSEIETWHKRGKVPYQGTSRNQSHTSTKTKLAQALDTDIGQKSMQKSLQLNIVYHVIEREAQKRSEMIYI